MVVPVSMATEAAGQEPQLRRMPTNLAVPEPEGHIFESVEAFLLAMLDSADAEVANAARMAPRDATAVRRQTTPVPPPVARSTALARSQTFVNPVVRDPDGVSLAEQDIADPARRAGMREARLLEQGLPLLGREHTLPPTPTEERRRALHQYWPAQDRPLRAPTEQQGVHAPDTVVRRAPLGHAVANDVGLLNTPAPVVHRREGEGLVWHPIRVVPPEGEAARLRASPRVRLREHRAALAALRRRSRVPI